MGGLAGCPLKLLKEREMNLNTLRNLLTVIFGVGGVGLNAIFPNINPALGAGIGLWVRAILDLAWTKDGLTKDWKNTLRNFLTLILASGDVLHSYLPFVPVGLGSTLALVVRATMDQVWPAQPSVVQMSGQSAGVASVPPKV